MPRLVRLPGLIALLLFLCLTPIAARAQFAGFESTALPAVTDAPGQWGLKIVVLNVGQADAILVMAPNGDVVLIDSGKTNSAGTQIADFLAAPALNGIGSLSTVDLLYSTHYDQDHIGGLPKLVERGVRIRKAFDQGISGKRSLLTESERLSAYGKYVAAVGDPNNNLKQDDDEPIFVRHRVHYGHIETIGREDQVEIRCVAVRGRCR